MISGVPHRLGNVSSALRTAIRADERFSNLDGRSVLDPVSHLPGKNWIELSLTDVSRNDPYC
jgi:hypothetical protein